VIACTISRTPKLLGGIAVMLLTKMLKADYMLIRLLCGHRVTKYVGKILLSKFKCLLRKKCKKS